MVRLKVLPTAWLPTAYCHFNSIMVRLKAPVIKKQELLRYYFNSIMVRLKEVILLTILALQQNFNSIMVRLKVLPLVEPENNSLKFQFHYGTIKRKKNNVKSLEPRFLFQFHYGTIKSK